MIVHSSCGQHISYRYLGIFKYSYLNYTKVNVVLAHVLGYKCELQFPTQQGARHV
jgi:hypothetical protein